MLIVWVERLIAESAVGPRSSSSAHGCLLQVGFDATGCLLYTADTNVVLKCQEVAGVGREQGWQLQLSTSGIALIDKASCQAVL